MVIRKRKHGCAPGKNASATGHSVTASAASPTSPSATEADFGVLGRRSGHSNRDAGQLQKRQQNRALTNSALNPEVRSFRDKRAKRENFGLAGQPGSAEVCAEKSMTVALFVRPTVRQRMWAQLGWRRETYRNPTFSTFAQSYAGLRRREITSWRIGRSPAHCTVHSIPRHFRKHAKRGFHHLGR